jgi:hypothetical protein
MKRNRKTQSRRYYLQNCIELPNTVDGVTKVINTPYADFMSIPVGQRYVIGQLIKYGYNVQYRLLELPAPKEPAPKEPAKKKPRKKPEADSNQLNIFK